MKVNYEIVEKRRRDIMTLIQKFGRITVEELANEFQTSQMTIRRDLQYWENLGAIQRTHGGARLIQSMVDHNEPYLTNDHYKHAIAKYAASFVENKDIIFINTSSTALLVIAYIKNKQCTIITNNAKALLIPHDPNITIVLTGGEIHYPKETMTGDFAIQNLSKVIATKCFIGCSGLSVESGITTSILAEAPINETMIKRTNGLKFVLCDYTKIGVKHSFFSSDIHQMNCVITDINADEAEVEQMRKDKIQVIKLEPIVPNIMTKHTW